MGAYTNQLVRELEREPGMAGRVFDLRGNLPVNPDGVDAVNRGPWRYHVDRSIGIALHHTGEASSWYHVAQWHCFGRLDRPRKEPWYHVAYGVGVSDSGVFILRNIEEGGNHVAQRNGELLGVAMLGDYRFQPPPARYLQDVAAVIRATDRMLGRKLPVRGHRDWAVPGHSTSCPGDFANGWARQYRSTEDDGDTSTTSTRVWSTAVLQKGPFWIETLARQAKTGLLEGDEELSEELHDWLVHEILPVAYRLRDGQG